MFKLMIFCVEDLQKIQGHLRTASGRFPAALVAVTKQDYQVEGRRLGGCWSRDLGPW